MIKFVDINTGDIFDGNKPYIHWFEDAQSSGLNYDKTFLFVSNWNTATITLDNECFMLVDDKKLSNATKNNFNGKDFIDLSKITSKQIDITGTKTNDLYIYKFSIIAQGKYIGEITDDFTITVGNETHTFSVGADFYDENEALGINLTNLGQDVNNEIQRALYEKNIYEDKPDYILLNRKYKELLNEYINIIANKGSYKSLINSLNWFEYGDLTKIYEFWRYGQPNKSYLSRQDITQYVNSITEQLLSSMQKTTYISIGCAMEKMSEESIMGRYDNYKDGKENNKNVTYLKEPVPELEKVSLYWTRDEMTLKMVLLGNFFATYFMPIHLDLIHSTIEDVVYTNTIKMLSDPLLWRFDNYDGINKFRLHVDKVYHLTNVETWTNIKTPFGYIHNTENSLTEEDAALHILGVDLEEDMLQDQTCRLKTFMMQHYKGIGVVVPFKCTLYGVFGSCVITDGELKIYKDGELFDERETQSVSQEKNKENPDEVSVDFNILLKEIGQYKVQIIFRRSDGVRYIKFVDFEIDEENHQSIEMYKLIPKDYGGRAINMPNKWMNNTDEKCTYTTLPDLAKWVLNPVVSDNSNRIYSQFLSMPRSTYNDNEKYRENDSVRANRVVMIRIKCDTNGNIPSSVKKIKISYGKPITNNSGSIGTGSGSIGYNTSIKKAASLGSISGVSSGKNPGISSIKSGSIGNKIIFNEIIGKGKTIGGNGRTPANCNTIGSIINGAASGKNNETQLQWLIMNRYGELLDETKLKPDELAIFGGTNYLFLIGVDLNFITSERQDYTINFSNVTDDITFWQRDMFIPYFYDLKKVGEISYSDEVMNTFTDEQKFKIFTDYNTYTIKQTDTVCFVPNLSSIKRPKDFQWKFVCKSTNDEITPITYRDDTDDYSFPTILTPLFGRYDFATLPDAGYYDVVLNYKLDDAQNKNNTVTVSSQFLVEK